MYLSLPHRHGQLRLGLFDQQNQSHSATGQCDQHHKRSYIAAGGSIQAAAGGGNEGGTDEVEIHYGEIGGEIFWTVESSDRGRRYGGAEAVRESYQAKSHNA